MTHEHAQFLMKKTAVLIILTCMGHLCIDVVMLSSTRCQAAHGSAAYQGHVLIQCHNDTNMPDAFYTDYDINNPPLKPPHHTRFIIISDTHGREPRLPEGDILLHAGDISTFTRKLESSLRWLSSQPHPVKFLVRGNHDLDHEGMVTNLMKNDWAVAGGVVVLEHKMSVVQGPERSWRIFGSPYWAPIGGGDGGEKAKRKMGGMPIEADVIITHGPPEGVLDGVGPEKKPTGCPFLYDNVAHRVKPKIHCFGHIHGARGAINQDGVIYVNAAISNGHTMNLPVIVDLDNNI